jgi:hypothetical protein
VRSRRFRRIGPFLALMFVIAMLVRSIVRAEIGLIFLWAVVLPVFVLAFVRPIPGEVWYPKDRDGRGE